MIEQMEFEDLVNKLKKRKDEGDINNAIKVADKIPWDEVEDVNLLMYAANVYDEGEHFKDAKVILEYAYDIAPVKNRLYFALSLICAKCKELKDAISYYIDFCDAFPDDNRKILLQYYIMHAKGASLDQQKRLLTEYLSEDKDEKMTFELALICDKLNEPNEVISYCNFIVDFFGVKKTGYGKNALLLKKKYVELTSDEEKLLKDANSYNEQKSSLDAEYKEPPVFYNATRLDEDKVNIPVEKIKHTSVDDTENNKGSESDEETLDDKDVEKSINISYTPDDESYAEKEKNSMAFMNSEKTDREKLKAMIKKLKNEEEIAKSEFNKFRQKSFEREGRFKKMKLSETKLHMIIEAHSKDEGIEIAQKELTYIHDILGEKASIAKASAYNINDKGFAYYESKIKDKDLIIENAGQLRNEILDNIEEYIINKKGKTIFALVDVINNFDKLATDRPSFVGRFDVYSVLSGRPQETIEATPEEVNEFKKSNGSYEEENKAANSQRINEKRDEIVQSRTSGDLSNNRNNEKKGNMSVDEFVDECKEYAKSIDCSMDGNTIAVLYEKVEEMADEKIPLTVENAIALIEEAADKAEKPKLFSKPKYDKNGCLILTEEHFNF